MIRLRAEWVAPVDGPPVADGTVVVAGDRIAAVGPTAQIAQSHPGTPVRDLGSVVLTAGFVDTHCHVEWSLAPPGTPCRGDFAGWLETMISRGTVMGPDDFLAAARLGVARALLAGTTLILDSGPTGAGARAATELGLRGHVHLEAFGRLDGAAATEAAESMAERVPMLDSTLVRGGVSPHAPYTVGPRLWAELAGHPELGGRPWMTHVAESDQELPAIAGRPGPLRDLFERRGSSPGHWPGTGSVVRRLDAGNALIPGMVAAHCVHVDDDDLRLLGTRGVAIAHCPVSNRDLGVGTHDLRAAIDAGVPVGLGSDSPATAGTYDVRAQVRESTITDPQHRLALATLEGARVAGRAAELGTLAPGKLADLVAVAVPAAVADPLPYLFEPSSNVTMTMVGGVTVAEEGRLLLGELERIVATAGTVAARLGA